MDKTQANVPLDNIRSGRVNHSGSRLKEDSAWNLLVSLAATSKVPVGMVWHVKQDSNGNILIVSYLSVFRYDGTSFTNISSEISLSGFFSVLDVPEDRKGNLWFGSRDSDVYYYNGKSFQHYTTKDGLASNTALHIF